MPEEPEVGDLFRRVQCGDDEAQGRLYEVLYDELRDIAQKQMARQPSGHTLQPTALVNEAYLRLCRAEDSSIGGRTHFVRLASRVMRQVLVDHARRRTADKREGSSRRVELDVLVAEFERRSGGLVELDEALERLQEQSPELVRLVELRFFGGRTMAEVGEALGVSERHAARLWSAARAFLRAHLEDDVR